MGRNWEELRVWQDAHAFVLELHPFIKSLPADERYALADQIRRAAYSVPANIVEGHSKGSLKDFNKFLYISRGSLEEVRYFLRLAKDLEYLGLETYEDMMNTTTKISKMINRLIVTNREKIV